MLLGAMLFGGAASAQEKQSDATQKEIAASLREYKDYKRRDFIKELNKKMEQWQIELNSLKGDNKLTIREEMLIGYTVYSEKLIEFLGDGTPCAKI